MGLKKGGDASQKGASVKQPAHAEKKAQGGQSKPGPNGEVPPETEELIGKKNKSNLPC